MHFLTRKNIFHLIIFSGISALTLFLMFALTVMRSQNTNVKLKAAEISSQKVTSILASTEAKLKALQGQNQAIINQNLLEEINLIRKNYDAAVKAYEKLLDLKGIAKNTESEDKEFAQILAYLADENYSSAEASIAVLTKLIDDDMAKIAASFQIPLNIASSNSPPSSGYQRQLVKTDIGEFMVDIVSADMNSTRVVVDTGNDSDCKNDCNVLSLADYVSRNGAYAGINGSYFCPASYPSCADKKNSFDTLAMNKDKHYINSDNNVYSTVPAVIFSGNSARFEGQSLGVGRSTNYDGVLANQPLLVSGGNVVFNADGEPKRGSKGSRSFVGGSGSLVYIGVVYNATVAEAAHAIQTLGIQNALNLDSGGSTALWDGGYKAGPGRAIPNAILFLRK